MPFEAVEDGIKAYAGYVEGKDAQYIKMGSTFFSQKAWQDEWISRKPRSRFAEEADDILDGIL